MGSTGPLVIGLADDHPIVRSALASALAGPRAGIRFREAADARGALALLDGPPPLDLLVIDLRMPGADGLSTVRALRERAPEVPLVVVSAEDDPAHIAPLLALGVAGFIPKSEPPAVIVRRCGSCSPGAPTCRRGSPPASAAPPPGAADAGLTPRQWEVVKLLARGLPNKAIANALGVTEGTVKVHLIAVFRALGVRNRTAAVIAARRYLD